MEKVRVLQLPPVLMLLEMFLYLVEIVFSYATVTLYVFIFYIFIVFCINMFDVYV